MAYSSATLIANGIFTFSAKQEQHLKKSPTLIAVDGGIRYCAQYGFNPNIYVGDLDSANEQDLAHFPQIKTHVFPKEKNKTDLQLAIEIALQTHAFLHIFGALGGRTDHSFFNLLLLTRFPEKIELLSNEETVFLINEQKSISTHPGMIVSLMPINGPAYNVTTSGLKWELNDATLDKEFTSLSNVALGSKISVRLAKGDLLCILSTTSPR